MDSFAFTYILWRIWNRFYEFFWHWYVRSFKIYGYGVVESLEKLDRLFAFKITWRHFGEPLFQDRSIVGYIMGFVFRSFWLAAGAIVYFFVILGAITTYIIWCLVPPYLIYRILHG